MSLARLRQGQGCVISVEAVAGCGWQEHTSPRSKVRGRHVKEMELPPIPAISFPNDPRSAWHVLRFVGKSRKVNFSLVGLGIIGTYCHFTQQPWPSQPASNRFYHMVLQSTSSSLSASPSPRFGRATIHLISDCKAVGVHCFSSRHFCALQFVGLSAAN
jgi:hypothetical protein